MKRTRLTILCTLLIICLTTSAQYQKPKVMTVPSDSWCYRNGYIKKVDTPYKTLEYPDYREALKNSELNRTLSLLNTLFKGIDYPLQDFEDIIEYTDSLLPNEKQESEIPTGYESISNPMKKICEIANIDILIELDWDIKVDSLKKNIQKKNLSLNIRIIDTFSNKIIKFVSGTEEVYTYTIHEDLLRGYLESAFDKLAYSLSEYFHDIIFNGREITFDVKVPDNDEKASLQTTNDKNSLTDIIANWIAKNAVKPNFEMNEITDYEITYSSVYIPTHTEQEKLNNAYNFLKGLMQHLNSEPFNIPCKMVYGEVGQIIFVIGEE